MSKEKRITDKDLSKISGGVDDQPVIDRTPTQAPKATNPNPPSPAQDEFDTTAETSTPGGDAPAH